MPKQIILALLILFYFPMHSFSQDKEMKTPYAKEWQQVDSFIDKGLPKSAQAVAVKVLADAKKKEDVPNTMKAQIYIAKLKYENEDESRKNQIKELESYVAHSSGVELAIWQSLTADVYWNYYRSYRYQIYQRTKLQATTSDDIDTWDADAFMARTAHLYEASLDQKELLQSTPVAQYNAIISKGVNTQSLRPTVYDLLAFKAIVFFQNTEASVVKAGDAFQMGGSLWYEPAARFSEVKVKVKDASSFKFKTLRLFQDVLAFHLRDATPEALIDADLQRLQFVHSNNVNPKNDSLYINALKDIASKYPENPYTAQAFYLIAVQQMDKAATGRTYGNILPKKSNGNLPEIKKQLQTIVAKFPKSEGGINAQNLINRISSQEVSLQTESVNIPNENIKALVTYKNVAAVFLTLYKLSAISSQDNYEGEDSLLIRIQKMTPLRNWKQDVPGANDMEQHSTEIKVDALPAGRYALVASSAIGVAPDDSQVVVYSEFQVSNISFIPQQGTVSNGYMLNRKTGYPLANVKAYFYGDNYSNSDKKKLELGKSISDVNGAISFPANKENDYRKTIRSTLFIDGTDTLSLAGYIDNYGHSESSTPGVTTFFFTDRSIYRPGQTLFFKGIMVKSSEGSKKNDVVVNQETTVDLYDANNQKKATLSLKSNEFGSFSGTFQLPDGLMNGSMRIQNENGDQSFSVEEYKRPKFYVDFDTLKGSYALNEAVTVKGFAKAYAGNNIDGAAVKYRVVRKARFPYFWCYYYWGMPTSTETEIANGTTTTNADGSFEISFETMPDLSVEPKTMPVFYYETYADITDINGETRSGNVQLISGYTSLQINASIPEQSKPKDLAQLDIKTENLNGVFTPASVSVSISRLKFPGFQRKRLWSVPDQFVMTESEFHKAFPNDEYKEESNHLNWDVEKVLFEKTFTTSTNQKLQIPEATWYQNGWYVIEMKTKDAQGNEIIEKKYTNVWAPGKKESNQEALIAYAEKDSYEPGDKLEIWLATGINEPYLLRTSSIPYKAKNPIEINIQEKDRGGMTFSWLYISNNRVYTVDKTINIPWSNKDLQLEWATHRDKLQPGAKEQWTLTIKGNKKEKVAAELLAGMYDASLDAFKPHNWEINKLFPSVYAYSVWNSNWGFGTIYSRQLKSWTSTAYLDYDKRYSTLSFNSFDEGYGGSYYANTIRGARRLSSSGFINAEAVAAPAPASADRNSIKKLAQGVYSEDTDVATSDAANVLPEQDKNIQIRTNLKETAFFFPQLKTDSSGNVSFSFEMPEALTEWKMMAVAHTKDWKTGYLSGKVKTQKDLMVMPNMPRFLRQGDNIQISTKIVNLSDKTLDGNATIQLLDAQTLQPLALTSFMQLKWSEAEKEAKQFRAEKGQSTTATWNLHVPESRYTPILVRIIAKSGAFSDGEENTLPVITNRMLVTETMPISMNGSETKNFTLDKLLNNTSPTVLNHGLTVEFTSNPAWYAVQALPYLMEYPYDCAEQTFNKFYANALAQNIVAQSPKVKQVFEQWQQKDTAALLSNLQKNEELKTALLEETPWVMEAQNESEQKHKIALLFQTHQLSKELDKAFEKLTQLQMPDGGFPWFKGMGGDRFITQYILTGLGRLQHLGVKNTDLKDAKELYSKALSFTDDQLRREYEGLLKSKADLKQQQIYNSQVQYLYMRSFYKESALSAANKKAFDYYMKQAAAYWPKFNPYLKGQLALALNRMGDAKTAQQIIASLKETAIESETLGMYWKDMPRGYSWSEAPIESQSLLIEAFAEIAKDNKAVDAMKFWLLKQKQTQSWNTTKATADACYALLLTGNNWLDNQSNVSIVVGKEKISSAEMATEAGTGYFKKRFAGKDVTKDMGNIQVTVQNSAPDNKNNTSWGAVYWQYFEDMDKVTTATAPIVLKKDLYIEKNSTTGPTLTAIKEGNELHVGDKVKVRIEVKVDRDMEYVQLKDMRAACFEPLDVLSQYKYQSGTGYFQSTKDLATNFFFDHLSKGTYVFEYAVWVNAKGNYSNGISTIQCMYAPEFSSHSAGIRVEVK